MKVCIVSSGLEARNRFVQPWQYLAEGAEALNRGGHQVYFISDGSEVEEKEFAGYPVERLDTLHGWPMLGNKRLARLVNAGHPDLVLWHLGLTSFMRLNTLRHVSPPVFGIFTSPIYRFAELRRLGIARLIRHHKLGVVHLLGLLVPSRLVRNSVNRGWLKRIVVECATTQAKLAQRGAPAGSLQVIRPSIDPAWYQEKPGRANCLLVREEYGFSADDFVVGYFGAPAALRGLTALVQAINLAAQTNPRIRLLALSRMLNTVNQRDHSHEVDLVKKYHLEQQVRIVPGVLPRERLIQSLSSCDAVALPFELVPSDVPLSVLETMALGIPLITTDTACLPELAPSGASIRVPPGDISRLAEAILTLADDAALRQKLAQAGRERALAWTSAGENYRAWNNLVE